jgi:hypothetical protein
VKGKTNPISRWVLLFKARRGYVVPLLPLRPRTRACAGRRYLVEKVEGVSLTTDQAGKTKNNRRVMSNS